MSEGVITSEDRSNEHLIDHNTSDTHSLTQSTRNNLTSQSTRAGRPRAAAPSSLLVSIYGKVLRTQNYVFTPDIIVPFIRNLVRGIPKLICGHS
jgi:hypothetical protein